VAGFGADRNESVSIISGGDRGCAKALGAPADRDVCGMGFCVLCRMLSRFARFYWSAGVWCDIIETRVTCHDLPGPGIGDRMRERAALSYNHRFRQRWRCRHSRIRHGGTPGYAMHDLCITMEGALVPGDVV
jgi:hypothetical protein